MKKILTLLAATLISSTAALANAPDFKTLDVDIDGVISAEELKVAFPDLDAETVSVVDIDASGTLSPDEYDALVVSLEKLEAK